MHLIQTMYMSAYRMWIDGLELTVPHRLTFPSLYSLASRPSLVGLWISPRREMNAFWVEGILSACSRRSIVWFDFRTGHGTSDLAALTHMTQPLAQGNRRGSWNMLTGSAAVSIEGLLFDWRSEIPLWLTFIVKKVADRNYSLICFLLTCLQMSTGSWFMLVKWATKTC